MEKIEKTPVGDIVRNYPGAAKVFASYNIDFCCGGEKPLEQVCSKKELDLDKIVEKVHQEKNSESGITPRFDRWNPGFLANYIEENHHTYVREGIPVILKWANKVAKVHGHWKPELVKINNLFLEIAEEMHNHLEKEEQQAFPLIREMENKADDPAELNLLSDRFAKLNDEMKSEHEEAGGKMAEIQELSNNFTPPEEACNTFRALYNALEEFQKDLHQHIHLENNILFPKATNMDPYSETAN